MVRHRRRWFQFSLAAIIGAMLFFVEFSGHERDARVKKALAALIRKALRFETLGSYPISSPVHES